MTFNEKKLEEFENKFPGESGWLDGCWGEDVTIFIEQSLIDKEQEVLKRVYGCFSNKKIVDTTGMSVYVKDIVDGHNFVLKSIEEVLDKEFKQ